MKITNYLLIVLFIYSITCPLYSQTKEPILFPQPQKIKITTPVFTSAIPYQIKGNLVLDEDAVLLLNQLLPFTSENNTTPFYIKNISGKEIPELLRSGAYMLEITPTEITIEIADNRSLFYAAQTLKQLIKKNIDGSVTLPACQITDYPDVAYRGTVEGFYGTPWNHQDRMEQLRFYGKMKLNTYIYGPKNDPYHSSPSWRESYPANQAAQLKDLVAEAQKNKVDFVWAIHPGKDIKWNTADSNAIIAKFESLYQLGIRSFAVFFDDITGEGTLPEKQVGLLNFIHKEFVLQKKDVKPLILCPTEYNKNWANPKPGTYLDILGEKLDPSILVMWTGNRIVNDITLEGLEWVNKRIRRPAFVWWNFPVSDYVRDHLLMGPAYGLDTEAAHTMSGFVANPMDKAEASKTAIFSIALYSWNMKSYQPEEAWTNACRYLVPEATEAFRIFSSHNCDPGPNGHQFRRTESVDIKPAADSFLSAYINGQYNKVAATDLIETFSEIENASAGIYQKCENKALIKEINPWLIQFGLLGKAGLVSVDMAKAWGAKDKASTWQQYCKLTSIIDSMRVIDKNMNQNELQPGVKTASLVLTPFIHKVYTQTEDLLLFGETMGFNERLNPKAMYTNIDQLKYQPVKNEDNQIACTSLFENVRMEAGDYFGLSWEMHKDAQSFTFDLPESSWDWGCFEWSVSGFGWEKIDMTQQKTKGTLTNIDPSARYLRFRNVSDQEHSLYLVTFSVKTKEAVGIDNYLLMFDKNLDSGLTLSAGYPISIDNISYSGVTLFLSGTENSPVTVKAITKTNEETILYQGTNGYIVLTQEQLAPVSTIMLSTNTTEEVIIRAVLRE